MIPSKNREPVPGVSLAFLRRDPIDRRWRMDWKSEDWPQGAPSISELEAIMASRPFPTEREGTETLRENFSEIRLTPRPRLIRWKGADGRQRELLLALTEPEPRNGGQPGGQGVLLDITGQRELTRRVDLLDQVLECTNQGIMVMGGDGRINMVNRGFCELTGFERDEALGRTPGFLFPCPKGNPQCYECIWRDLKTQGRWQGEVVSRRKDGGYCPQLLTMQSIRDPKGRELSYVGEMRDLTSLKRNQEQLAHQVYHDRLTGLPNRLLFQDRLKMALAHVKRQKNNLAVLFLDVDNFKHVNESLGYQAGDDLLVALAQRLRLCLRDEDTLARLGGDDFLFLLVETNQEEAAQVARRMNAELAKPFRLDKRQLFVHPSMGIAVYPGDGCNPEKLMANAELAMYRAKENKGGGYCFFEPVLNQKVNRRLELENRLRLALDNNEFMLHYQPKIDLISMEVVGVEALLRWQRDGCDLISPSEFIPVAEDIGLINPLGRWVLRQSCLQVQKWQQRGMILDLAVNLSPRQLLDPELIESVQEALDVSGLPPACLELEITENAVMPSLDLAQQKLTELRRLGVRLAMDDFGRGYSSLYHLHRLPIETLKIDQSFVANLDKDPEVSAIVQAMITMGHGLELTVVAEGVERSEQFEQLKQMGCHQVQGFLFCRPLAADDFENFLKQTRVTCLNSATAV